MPNVLNWYCGRCSYPLEVIFDPSGRALLSCCTRRACDCACSPVRRRLHWSMTEDRSLVQRTLSMRRLDFFPTAFSLFANASSLALGISCTATRAPGCAMILWLASTRLGWCYFCFLGVYLCVTTPRRTALILPSTSSARTRKCSGGHTAAQRGWANKCSGCARSSRSTSSTIYSIQ